MRVAIFSDVHGNLSALETVLQDIDQQTVDEIVFAGDLCLLGPHPKACLNLLQRRDDIAAIYGNTDEWIYGPPPLSDDIDEEERQQRQRIHDVTAWPRTIMSEAEQAWLQALPFHHRISPTTNPLDDLYIVHANPVDVNQIIFPPQEIQQSMYGEIRQPDHALEPLLRDVACGVLAFGHLHIPSIRHWNERVLLNVSSVSIPGDGDPRAKYALLEWNGETWQIGHRKLDYPVKDEIEAFRAARPPGWKQAVEALELDGMLQQKV